MCILRFFLYRKSCLVDSQMKSSHLLVYNVLVSNSHLVMEQTMPKPYLHKCYKEATCQVPEINLKDHLWSAECDLGRWKVLLPWRAWLPSFLVRSSLKRIICWFGGLGIMVWDGFLGSDVHCPVIINGTDSTQVPKMLETHLYSKTINRRERKSWYFTRTM